MPLELLKDYLKELQEEYVWASRDLMCEKFDDAWDTVDYVITGQWIEKEDD